MSNITGEEKSENAKNEMEKVNAEGDGCNEKQAPNLENGEDRNVEMEGILEESIEEHDALNERKHNAIEKEDNVSPEMAQRTTEDLSLSAETKEKQGAREPSSVRQQTSPVSSQQEETWDGNISPRRNSECDSELHDSQHIRTADASVKSNDFSQLSVPHNSSDVTMETAVQNLEETAPASTVDEGPKSPPNDRKSDSVDDRSTNNTVSSVIEPKSASNMFQHSKTASKTCTSASLHNESKINAISSRTSSKDNKTLVQQRTTISQSETNIAASTSDKSPSRTLTSSQDVDSSMFCLDQDDDLLSELDAELDNLHLPKTPTEVDPINGLLKKGAILEDIPEFTVVRRQADDLQKQVTSLHAEIKSLQSHLSGQQQKSAILEEERDALKMKMKQADSVQSVHLLRIKELELMIDQQKVELTAAKERQISHDAAAKKAIGKLQQEMILRVDQVKSLYEEAIKEKESIVIRYAKSEKEVLDQKKLREALGKSHKELNLTLETLKAQLHDTKKDRTKLKNTAASKETEASYLQKEIDQFKEEVSSQGIKVRWAQNKLKTEIDAHKDTKVKLSKTEQRLTESKEETEQIRKNCQEMIQTYQTSEEVKSNSLDKQLKVKNSELEQKLQEQKDHLEVHQARLRELGSLKKSLTDNVAELDSLRVKNKCLEDERLQNEELLAKFKELLNSQKEENRRLNRQMEEKKALSQQVEELKVTEIQLRSEVSGQKVDQSDLELELEDSRKKVSELLQFTEKITTKNTFLSSENATLHSKASQLESDVKKLQQDLDQLQSSYSQLTSDLKQERQFRERESMLLTSKLNEKSRAVEQLSIQLDEARDDNKTLRRKHAANTKDLTRQLQHAHKRLESLDSTENPPRDNISVGSRTSSSGSLDTLPSSAPSGVNSSGSSTSVSAPSTVSRPDEHSAPQDHTVAIATGNDYPGVDKGMLVDRIVRLQKAHQRKNEKMDFMQEHITHLVEELKKKSKIIQQYIMRDEAGALVPVASDINKAQIAKQGGIMSSVYRSQSTDPTMTLDLSLEINQKLQAVLEDTLLKNITLKENIETLGHEIARLLKEEQKKPNHPAGLR